MKRANRSRLLIRYHQAPFYLINRADSLRMAFLISQTARCDLLAIIAKADALGRECKDSADLSSESTSFGNSAANNSALIIQEHSRQSRGFQYFRTEDRDPNYVTHDESRCEVILMSGLPGAGKDTWIRHTCSFPSSTDFTRHDPSGNRSGANWQPRRCLFRLRENAPEYLLRQGESFVWNATNLSREIRSQLIDLFTAYHARTRIIYVETTNDRLFVQNQQRPNAVPINAIERMMERWEIPDPTEASCVEFWENGET